MNNNNDLNNDSKKYNKPLYIIITLLICAMITALVAASRYSRYDESAKVIARIIVSIGDGCFVSGILVGGLGGLVLISGEGFFDLMAYGFTALIKALTKKNNYHESFIDYKQRKESERGNAKIWFIAAVGALFVVLGILKIKLCQWLLIFQFMWLLV